MVTKCKSNGKVHLVFETAICEASLCIRSLSHIMGEDLAFVPKCVLEENHTFVILGVSEEPKKVLLNFA